MPLVGENAKSQIKGHLFMQHASFLQGLDRSDGSEKPKPLEKIRIGTYDYKG